MRHKVVLVAPGCGGFKASGTPATPSPAAAWPFRAAHQLGRAQSTPLRLRLRSQPARFVAGLSFARTGTPALLPAAGAFVAVPLAAIAANAPQPQRPVRCSPTRCAVVDAYGPSLNASGRPVARA